MQNLIDRKKTDLHPDYGKPTIFHISHVQFVSKIFREEIAVKFYLILETGPKMKNQSNFHVQMPSQ